jgi:exopolyphosphatase/guanosine-5'-triphosphate,3'-diphosphate pyrophosphatase
VSVNRAVISLGTNTIRLLVVRPGDDGVVEQIEHLQTGTRLGEGLRDRGPLAPAAKTRTLAAVTEFAQAARAHRATISCIATSAMRRASDAAIFAAEVEAVTGAPLQILAGRVEAQASFRGATYGIARDGARIAVLDIGGGSTECAVGRNDELQDEHSVEIGSVRLTEMFPQLSGNDPGESARAAAREARAFLQVELAALARIGSVDRFVAVAGTALTIAAVAHQSHVERVSGTTLSLATIEETIDVLLALPLDARRELPGMLPQRADVLAAGGLILSSALSLTRVREVVAESNDLLLGFLLGVLDAEGVGSRERT